MFTKTASSDGNHDCVAEAVVRVRAGDVDAFAGIVDAYENKLRSWLYLQTPAGIDPDEIAQQSFVTAFIQIDQFTIGTNFLAWLFTLARFHLRTAITQANRIDAYQKRYLEEVVASKWLTDTEAGLADTTLKNLEHCVGELDPSVQQMLRWRYYDSLPLSEISQRTGRSVAAIKKQLWKARRKLFQCLTSKNSTQSNPLIGTPNDAGFL